MRFFLSALIALTIQLHAAWGEAVVATRTIRPGTIITPTDVVLDPNIKTSGIDDLSTVLGQEAKTTLYSGRQVQPGDFGPPAIVDRNAIVELAFIRGGLTILVEGRALSRGAAGELVRVMNLASRRTVVGQIQPSGRVIVNASVNSK